MAFFFKNFNICNTFKNYDIVNILLLLSLCFLLRFLTFCKKLISEIIKYIYSFYLEI